MRKTDGLVKYPVIFLKPIRMQYDLMVFIFTIPLKKLPCKKCVPVPLNIMGYCNGNACYVVVISAQVFYYPVRRQINIQQKCVQQYNFISTVMFHVVLCMGNVHNTNEKHVHCAPQQRALKGLPKYTHEKNCVT